MGAGALSPFEPSDPLARAALAGDAEAFDALVDERAVWRRLAQSLGDARDTLADRMPRRGGEIDVGETLAQGQPGFWLATAWLFEALPTARVPLLPAHERWDVLVDRHRQTPEAAWLCAELAAALTDSQAGLRRRVVLGFAARFGERGGRIWRARTSLALPR